MCSEFSRIKNADDGGPKPIRTAEFPEGLPDLTESEQRRLANSKLLLERCVALLDVVFSARGHVSLEQPRNALSWLYHEVQEFLKRISADLNAVPACSVGVSIHKHWLFASSWRPLQSMAACCNHSYAEHTDVRGSKDADGNWLSQSTAAFPEQLCQRFATALHGIASSRCMRPLVCYRRSPMRTCFARIRVVRLACSQTHSASLAGTCSGGIRGAFVYSR